jgi:hypothetical protein
MNRPAGANASAASRRNCPNKWKRPPVGRVQLQSRVDAVLSRALRAPPLAAAREERRLPDPSSIGGMTPGRQARNDGIATIELTQIA